MDRVDAPSYLHINNLKMMHIITWLEDEEVGSKGQSRRVEGAVRENDEVMVHIHRHFCFE